MLSDLVSLSLSLSLNSVGFHSTVCWIFLRYFLFTFWQGWIPGAPGLSLLLLCYYAQAEEKGRNDHIWM